MLQQTLVRSEESLSNLDITNQCAVVVYHEKHNVIAAIVPVVGEPRFVKLDCHWFPDPAPGSASLLVLPDRILTMNNQPSMITGYSLPELTMLQPLGVPGVVQSQQALRIVDDSLVVPLKGGGEARVSLGTVPRSDKQVGTVTS